MWALSGKPESLEKHLLSLPTSNVIAALKAINELDHLLLLMLERAKDQKRLIQWREKIDERRRSRQLFLRYRLMMDSPQTYEN